MRQPRPHRIRWVAVLFFAAFCSPAAAQSTQNPLQLRPDHATAAVTDLDRAVRWYQDMLGFRVLNRGARPNGSRFADLEIPGTESASSRILALHRQRPARGQAGFISSSRYRIRRARSRR